MPSTVQAHNEQAAATWDAGGADYDGVSRTIADSMEHCVRRLGAKAGERVLDLATGTGWTARVKRPHAAQRSSASTSGRT